MSEHLTNIVVVVKKDRTFIAKRSLKSIKEKNNG